MSAEGARSNQDGRIRSSSDGANKRNSWNASGKEFIRDEQGNVRKRINDYHPVIHNTVEQGTDRKIVKSQFSNYKKNLPIQNNSNVIKYKQEVICFNCGESGHYKSNCTRVALSRTNSIEQKLIQKQKEVEDLVSYINSQKSNEVKYTRSDFIQKESQGKKSESFSLLSSDEEYDKRYNEQIELQKEYMQELSKQGYSGDVSPKKRNIKIIDLDKEDSVSDSFENIGKKDYKTKLSHILEEIEVKKQKIEYIKAVNELNELDDIIVKLGNKKFDLDKKDSDKITSKDSKDDSLEIKNKKKKKKKEKDTESDPAEKASKENVLTETNKPNVDKTEKNDKDKIEKNYSEEDTNPDDELEDKAEDKDKDNETQHETIYKELIDLIKRKKENGKYRDAASWRYVRDYITKAIEKCNDGDALIKYMCKRIGKKVNTDKSTNLEEIAKALLL